MSDKALRSQLIRIAHENPELRPHLLPLIQASTEKKAHGPVALRDPDVMLYMIDSDTNTSKFYEMKVVQRGKELPARATKDWARMQGGMVLMRRWGRLTDVGGVTGRVDSMNDIFESLGQAHTAMHKLMFEKERKGYKNVSRTQEYPIGLGGAGFGWGSQAACAYVPELQQLSRTVNPAIDTFLHLRTAIGTLASRDSSMGKKLALLLEATITPMLQLDGYLTSQLAECRG